LELIEPTYGKENRSKKLSNDAKKQTGSKISGYGLMFQWDHRATPEKGDTIMGHEED